MATEHNHQTLKNAIGQLPRYAPKASVWGSIERQLEEDFAQATLQDAIQQLPSYAPPAALWERIEADLNQPAVSRLRVSRTTWISIAAAIILAIVSLVFWLNQTPEPEEHVQFVYAEAQQNAINADWDDDEAVIENVAKAYAQRASFLQNEQSETLLSDLEELNKAKAEIQTMMKKYGRDVTLIQNMVEIERERTEIVKKMAQEI